MCMGYYQLIAALSMPVVSRHYKKKRQTAAGRWQPSADDLIADDCDFRLLIFYFNLTHKCFVIFFGF